MANKQVSPDQIEALFKFMRQKYVDYYDVQIELVDHFACAIEDIWGKRPATTFDQAVQQVYRRFPLTGFYQLIEEKRTALLDRIKAYTWKYVKDFFQLPKIMATILAVVILYLFFNAIPRPTLFAFLLMAIVTIRNYYLINNFKQKDRFPTKRFLVLETLQGSQVGLAVLVNMPHYIFHEPGAIAPWLLLGLSVLTVVFILVSIGHYKVASSMYSDWQQQFPKFV